MARPLELDTSSRLVLHRGDVSGLGGPSLAGFLQHSRGVGWRDMRILGRYAAVYVHEGRGVFQDALGHDLSVTAGDLLLIQPDVPHRYGPRPGSGDRWSEFYVVFSGSVFDACRSAGVLAPSRPRLRLTPVSWWLRRLHQVVWPAGTRLQQACRLLQFLADAHEAFERASTPNEDVQFLHRARAALAELRRPLRSVADIAADLGCGYESFRKRFAALAGVPPARYRAERLISHAAKLLHQPGLSVRQVADRCGFCDEFHFARRFKQLTGVTPSAFRRQLSVI